ncbi:MAG: lysophospholipase [Marmoricola sp.]|nr:lysophospholipase [Marmoricola sp.]
MHAPDETTLLSTPDGVKISVNIWRAPAPRGVVQLTHGMGEHVLRYGEFARALNAAGWTVSGQDHRGHGANVSSAEELGQLGAAGWTGLVTDIDVVREISRHESHGGGLVLFGHSMGSFAVQQYLPTIGDKFDAVILTGTAALDLLEPAIDLDTELDLAMFNAPFAPARTDFDWLSRDESAVDAYVADPLCGFGLDIEATKALFAGARAAAAPDALTGVRADLPVHIAVGAADPVNADLALVHALSARYTSAGLSNVSVQTYPGARHELVNETNREAVVADLVRVLDGWFPRQ